MRKDGRVKYWILCLLCLLLGYEVNLGTRAYLMDLVCLCGGPFCFFFLKNYQPKVIAYFSVGVLAVILFAIFDFQNELDNFEIFRGTSRNLGYVFSIIFGFLITARLGIRRAVLLILIVTISFSLLNLYNFEMLGYPIRHSFKYGGGYFVLNFVSVLISIPLLSSIIYILIMPILGIYYQYRGILLIGLVTGVLPIIGSFVGKRSGPFIICLIGLSSLIALYGAYHYLEYQSLISGSAERDTASTDARFNMILDSLGEFARSPIMGNGSYSQSQRHFDALDSSYFTGVHSVFFQLLAEYGVLGGIFSIIYFLGPVIFLFMKRVDFILNRKLMGRYLSAYSFLLVYTGYCFFLNPFTGFWRNIFGLTVGSAIAILSYENPVHHKLLERRRG